MKSLLTQSLLTSFLFHSAIADAAPVTYGAAIDGKTEATTLQSLIAAGRVDTTVVTKGAVKEVCQKKGCWMAVEDQGSGVRVMFANYGFFVPQSLKGKTVKLQGKLVKKTLSEDEARHYLEDAKKPEAEVKAIKGPQTVYQFVADGVETL